MKLKRWISLIAIFCLACSSLLSFVVRADGVWVDNIWEKRDVEVHYSCSFDIPLDSSFSNHPVYQYADNGILHVTAYPGLHHSCHFQFGSKNTITITAGLRNGAGSFVREGEWGLPSNWSIVAKWDKLIYDQSNPEDEKVILKDFRWEKSNTPFQKEGGEYIELAIDMVENKDDIMIRMYLHNPNKSSLAGTLKPVSTVANYIPSSFKEMNLLENLVYHRGNLFKRDGNWETALEGTEESEQLEQKRKEFLDSLIDYTPVEYIEYEKSNDEIDNSDEWIDSRTDRKNADDETNSDKKDENKLSDNTEPTEKGINQGENVPESYRGLTKEESLEKYNAYYDADGNWHHRFYYTGTTSNGLRRTTDAVNKIEFTVPQNMGGVSSNGTTRFTIYEIEQTLRFEGRERSRKDTVTILQANGNMGTEYFEIGNTAWRIPKGSTVSNFPGLDENTSYYGWNEVEEINEKYIETVGRGSEAGSIKIHFADSARTGIESLEFDFDGLHTKMFYEDVDYIGPFFTFFMGYSLDEEWLEAAKRLGLTAKVQEEE